MPQFAEMTDAPLPSLFELTPMNPAYRADPHALLDDLRTRCPAHQDSSVGSVIFTRYEDVRAVVNDRDLWRRPRAGGDDSDHADQHQARHPITCGENGGVVRVQP